VVSEDWHPRATCTNTVRGGALLSSPVRKTLDLARPMEGMSAPNILSHHFLHPSGCKLPTVPNPPEFNLFHGLNPVYKTCRVIIPGISGTEGTGYW
jgi:hypothetical protein